MTPFISTHMIIKENTNLGIKFLNASLSSLYECQYPSELIIVDNNSSNCVFEQIYDVWKPKFEKEEIKFEVIRSDCANFMDLRNLCLFHTNKKADYFHWIDSDEIYYSADLDLLKFEIMAKEKNVSQLWTYFYHFMISPFMIQSDNLRTKKLENLIKDEYRSTKDNVFAYHPSIRWGKGKDGQVKKVHEKVENPKEGRHIDVECEYLHLGYTRRDVDCLTKWLFYDYVEHGHINHYKMENVSHLEDGTEVENGTPNAKMTQKEYLREWRVPFEGDFLWDRRKYCTPFPNKACREDLPESFITLLNGSKNEADWRNYIDKLDHSEFLDEWVQEYNKTKSWAKSLDWFLEEAIKRKWVF